MNNLRQAAQAARALHASGDVTYQADTVAIRGPNDHDQRRV